MTEFEVVLRLESGDPFRRAEALRAISEVRLPVGFRGVVAVDRHLDLPTRRNAAGCDVGADSHATAEVTLEY
ncbi:hypothetical protein GCM10010399_42240 [Dactylosporangium fulvum]|uniref:Uncharacterized protein n=1 Tax=Dactylosporangium fulvum TaxID=53359 RepID=A0ABY5VWH6_9ACTN|nr:hypothetical protein [Dactylosporangium fulvum]UWP81597.1 hypothetical protein Dfulv_41845 [Dactylosporangium fulvum]